MIDNKALNFAKKSIKEKSTPKYVKKQCRDFIKICNGKNDKYVFDEKKYIKIEKILKLLVMPKGLKAGQSLYECTAGYQWLFYVAVLCVVHRDNPKKRRYETALLEICRKNFKTYTIAKEVVLDYRRLFDVSEVNE